jgi:hypothetical protein
MATFNSTISALSSAWARIRVQPHRLLPRICGTAERLRVGVDYDNYFVPGERLGGDNDD